MPAGAQLLPGALLESWSSSEAQILTRASPPFEITHVNDAWVNLCGFSRGEAVGQTCRILQGPDTSVKSLQALHTAVAARAPITVRLLNYTKGGAPFLNQLSLAPLKESEAAGADVTHYVGTLRAWRPPDALLPTAPRAHALQTPEEQTRTSQVSSTLPTTLEAALGLTSVAQIITEASAPFRIVHVNPAWSLQCGYSAEEVCGRTCSILQGPATCSATLQALKAACLEHRPINVRLVNYAKVSGAPMGGDGTGLGLRRAGAAASSASAPPPQALFLRFPSPPQLCVPHTSSAHPRRVPPPMCTQDGRPFMNTLSLGPLASPNGPVTHWVGLLQIRFVDDIELVNGKAPATPTHHPHRTLAGLGGQLGGGRPAPR